MILLELFSFHTGPFAREGLQEGSGPSLGQAWSEWTVAVLQEWLEKREKCIRTKWKVYTVLICVHFHVILPYLI